MVKVKICGMTELRDALKAHELGADMVGFVFFKNSPRVVDPDHARVIIEDLPKELLKVGLFLDQPLDEVRATAKKCHLDLIQLHGTESDSYSKDLKKYFKIIKSFRIKDEEGFGNVEHYENADYYLFDNYVKGMPGGTGKIFDWSLMSGKSFSKPFFLAGGLNPGNVKRAIEKVSPYAVDVASGVEKSPGKKDYKRLKEFIDNAKKA